MKRAQEITDFAKDYHIDAVIDRKLIGTGKTSHEDIQAVIHSDSGEVDKKAESPGKGKEKEVPQKDAFSGKRLCRLRDRSLPDGQMHSKQKKGQKEYGGCKQKSLSVYWKRERLRLCSIGCEGVRKKKNSRQEKIEDGDRKN